MTATYASNENQRKDSKQTHFKMILKFHSIKTASLCTWSISKNR